MLVRRASFQPEDCREASVRVEDIDIFFLLRICTHFYCHVQKHQSTRSLFMEVQLKKILPFTAAYLAFLATVTVFAAEMPKRKPCL